jgi:Large ribosomal RNA subunit accumulation protein YceD
VEISLAGLIGQTPASATDKTKSMTKDVDPWSVPVTVAQIPDTGLHREIEADQAAREAMAAVAGLREILSARASFDLTLKKAGHVHVAGWVRARIGQTCVVSLDPIENDIDETIDLIFAPPEQIPELAELVDDATESDAEIPDPPEPIVDGVIDLGRLATDALFLGIDPYPRRPDAVFEPMIEAADPGDHPFAALKALQASAKPRAPSKPKKR